MKLAFFGAGHIAETEIKAGNIPDVIFDNNPELWGRNFLNVPIRQPTSSAFDEIDSIIICSSSIGDIEKLCQELGFELENIGISQYLGEFAKTYALEKYRFDGFISSGLPSRVENLEGGGIFHVFETEPGFASVEKIFEANTHGCLRDDDDLVFCAQGHGIVTYNIPSKCVTDVVEIDRGLRPHGVRRTTDGYLIVCTLDDSVRHYDFDGKLLNTYRISLKKDHLSTAQHHCNDLWVTNHSIYVSMFSISGNWKRGVFDGGVVEIDRSSGQLTPVISGLTMPHSVQIHGDVMYVLDSFTGSVLGHDARPIGVLNGFVRGLAFDQEYVIVGESKNRNATKMDRGSHLASVDSRVTIIDPSIGICRSIQIPNTISEIHSVVI